MDAMAQEQRKLQTTLSPSHITRLPGLEEAVASRGISMEQAFSSPHLMRRSRLSVGDRKLLHLDSLPDEMWEEFDEMVVQEGGDVLGATAAMPQQMIMNPVATTVIESPRVDDQSDTHEGMSPDVQTPTERLDFSDVKTPIPFTWLSYEFPAELDASRFAYVAQVVANGMRAVMESLEKKLFAGLGGTYQGMSAAGFRTPGITRTSRSSNAAWNAAAKSGPQYLNDVLARQKNLVNAERYGNLILFVSPAVYTQIRGEEFTSEYPRTILSRLLETISPIIPTSGVEDPNNVYFVEQTGATFRWATAMAPSVIQWVTPTGFTRHVMVIAKAVPVVVPTYSGQIGARVITG